MLPNMTLPWLDRKLGGLETPTWIETATQRTKTLLLSNDTVLAPTLSLAVSTTDMPRERQQDGPPPQPSTQACLA